MELCINPVQQRSEQYRCAAPGKNELKRKMRPETIQVIDQRIAEEFNAPRNPDRQQTTTEN